MSSRAEQIRAQETRRSERRAAAADPEQTRAPRHQAPAVRAKPVRKTVDLPPARYAALTAWCSETAVSLGQSRVTGQQVFNALVSRLLSDETLARKIRADLAEEIASA